MTARTIIALIAVLTAACGSPSPPSPGPVVITPPPGPTGTPLRVLMVTATAGFRHDSIPTARQTLSTLSFTTGEFSVAFTEDVSEINAARLGSIDIVFFGLTSGELPLDASQKAALLNFVNQGGGFIGVHSATDTLYDWPDYGRLIGAYFKEHPWTQDATVNVEDRAHPSTASLGASFRLFDEFYTFRENPRPAVRVLLTLDAPSVGASGDFPLAWSQTIGSGRTYYNALGHFMSTWNNATFQSQILGAIRWTGKKL